MHERERRGKKGLDYGTIGEHEPFLHKDKGVVVSPFAFFQFRVQLWASPMEFGEDQLGRGWGGVGEELSHSPRRMQKGSLFEGGKKVKKNNNKKSESSKVLPQTWLV